MSAPLLADLCSRCRHLSGVVPLSRPSDAGEIVSGEAEVAGACAAFPNGIPDAIAEGDVEHREPYPGDRGIRFEPA
jgi:hypothetical protein